jgi:hypothetical protein
LSLVFSSEIVYPDHFVSVGLDAAGKTTILYKLKLGEIVTTIPTIGLYNTKFIVLVSEMRGVRYILENTPPPPQGENRPRGRKQMEKREEKG